jgi:hypothetical protein
MNTAPVKGRARINVSDDLIRLASVKIEKPKAGEIIWEMMEAKGLFDTFQSFLLLPDEYTIIGVFFELPYYQWTVIVESDTLPLPKEGMMLPILMPTYQRTEDGKVRISQIQVML